MAAKPQAKPEPAKKDEVQDGPLMDGGAAFKKLLAKGKERGYVTVDELNANQPTNQTNKQNKNKQTKKNNKNNKNVENEESEEAEGEAQPAADGEQEESRAVGNLDDADVGLTVDPVRM